VAGTATVSIPDVPVSEPSRLPWLHKRRVQADVLEVGMAKVASVAERLG
jgi:hypothetical protein